MGTADGTLVKSLDLVMNELKNLREKKLGTAQLKRAKTQMIGQIAINFEANLNKMLSMGRSFIMEKKIDTLDSINSRIEAITASDIMDVANEVFSANNLSTLIYKSQ
jgi:predicted Zn-dependent peptidase